MADYDPFPSRTVRVIGARPKVRVQAAGEQPQPQQQAAPEGWARNSEGEPVPERQPIQIPQLPPGPLDQARQKMGVPGSGDVRVQGSPPPLDLSQLQQHGLSNGGAPSYAQPDATAPVQINAPNVKTPPGRGIDLPNGGGYQVGNTVYRSSNDYSDQRGAQILQDMQRAGMMGVQNGLYAPTGDDQMAMLGQQQANYGRGVSNFAQAMAAQSQEEQADLNRQIGLGHLGVEQGKLGLASDVANATQSVDRAKLASGESIAGKTLSSEELRARQKYATELEQERMRGASHLAGVRAQNKGLGSAASTQTLLQANAALIGKGGPAAEQTIKGIQAVTDALHPEKDLSGDTAAMAPDPALLAWLNTPQGQQAAAQLTRQGQQPGGQTSPQQPAPGGNVNVPAPPPVKVEGPQGKKDPFAGVREMGQQLAEKVPQESINQKLGVIPATPGGATSFTKGSPLDSSSKSDVVKGVLDKLSEYASTDSNAPNRLDPKDVDHVIQSMLDSGMTHEDIRSGLAKEHVRLSRNLGDLGGRYKFQADRNKGDITIYDPNGNEALKGVEGTGPTGSGLMGTLRRYGSGTEDLIPNLRQSSDTADKKKRAVGEQMLDRFLPMLEALRKKK